jgi:hypothetical protein
MLVRLTGKKYLQPDYKCINLQFPLSDFKIRKLPACDSKKLLGDYKLMDVQPNCIEILFSFYSMHYE